MKIGETWVYKFGPKGMGKEINCVIIKKIENNEVGYTWLQWYDFKEVGGVNGDSVVFENRERFVHEFKKLYE